MSSHSASESSHTQSSSAGSACSDPISTRPIAGVVAESEGSTSTTRDAAELEAHFRVCNIDPEHRTVCFFEE